MIKGKISKSESTDSAVTTPTWDDRQCQPLRLLVARRVFCTDTVELV
jgi:hypothetical protein